MSSAICFNKDQSKILSSVNGLKTEIIILAKFTLLSENAFSMVKAKILSFGKEFSSLCHFQTTKVWTQAKWKHLQTTT